HDDMAAFGARRRAHAGGDRGDLPHRVPGLFQGGFGMTVALETVGLGKRYGRRWALSDCTLSIPTGRVVGLVGPNGAGKTTLLHLITGLLTPTAGTIEVAGGQPAARGVQLARVGFVAQDTPIYAAFSIADHLRLGAH